MENLFNKWKGPAMLLILALVMGLMLGTSIFDMSGFTGEAEAALKESKRVGFMGWQYDDSLGNTLGDTDNVKVGSPNVPDEYNCFFSVTNSVGQFVTNTASVEIRTSYDNALFDVVRTVSVANGSVVTGARNTPGATSPFGNYWDLNITVIQNANDTRVNGQCIFE